MRIATAIVVTMMAGLLAGCPVTQPQDTPVSARHIVDPETGRKYWLYVPSYYTNQRKWPLVISLHGSKVWDGPIRQIMEWKDLAERHGFLIAAPRAKSAEGILPVLGRRDLLEEDEKVVLGAIEDIDTRYGVNRDAVMLTGFSAGGYPLYWIGLRNPGTFNMLIARACNASLDHLERIEPTDEARKLPIVIFWGKDDLLPIQKQSWAAFRWLREHRFFETDKQQVRGGHLRRPELAYRFWVERMPDDLRKQMR